MESSNEQDQEMVQLPRDAVEELKKINSEYSLMLQWIVESPLRYMEYSYWKHKRENP